MESEVGNRIYFSNDILKNKTKKYEPKVYYALKKYKQTGSYKLLKDISENVNLVQLMGSFGNVNDAISVFWYWIFDSNY